MNLSVVVTSYGDQEWAQLGDRAAESALDQTGAHEVITRHFTEKMGEHWIGPARNEAAKDATGDWLLFLDADDVLSPGFLSAVLVAGRRVNYSSLALLTPRASYVIRGRARPAKFLRRPGVTLRDDNFLVVGTAISRELFDKVDGFSDYPHGFEDWSLWAKAYRAGARVVEVPKAIYIVNVNENSKHRQGWKDRNWQVETHERVRREIFPELYV